MIAGMNLVATTVVALGYGETLLSPLAIALGTFWSQPDLHSRNAWAGARSASCII